LSLEEFLDSTASAQPYPKGSTLRFDDELQSKKGTTTALEQNPLQNITSDSWFGRKPEGVAILEFQELRRERADLDRELGAPHALSRREGAEIARDHGLG
jgi:hypothetical protein